jgi:hypothetical protein
MLLGSVLISLKDRGQSSDLTDLFYRYGLFYDLVEIDEPVDTIFNTVIVCMDVFAKGIYKFQLASEKKGNSRVLFDARSHKPIALFFDEADKSTNLDILHVEGVVGFGCESNKLRSIYWNGDKSTISATRLNLKDDIFPLTEILIELARISCQVIRFNSLPQSSLRRLPYRAS